MQDAHSMTGFDDKMKALRGYPIWEPAGPVDADAVFASLEQEFGRPLPADYKEFVRKFGQFGFDQPVTCRVEARFAAGTACRVNTWFGLRPDKDYFLLKERDSARGRMPDHLLAIANDPGDSVFVLSIGPDDYAKVYYWDHEHIDLPRGRIPEMASELGGEGIDVQPLSIDQIVLVWDRRHRGELGRPPGYGNVYHVADSFASFIDALRFEGPVA